MSVVTLVELELNPFHGPCDNCNEMLRQSTFAQCHKSLPDGEDLFNWLSAAEKSTAGRLFDEEINIEAQPGQLSLW